MSQATQIKNPLEIFKFLPKTNCRECDLPTCMAFADAVIKGQKTLHECPYLDKSIIEKFDGKISRPPTIEEQQEKLIQELKEEVPKIDILSSTERLKASTSEGKLKIRSLGRSFYVDTEGNLTSECHINHWIGVPILNYVIHCKGVEETGNWLPFRELEGGMDRQPLFNRRCEIPLQHIADHYPDLLLDYVVYVFGGRPVSDYYYSDHAYILYPLPRVPMLICYNDPDDDIGSQLNVFFDACTNENLGSESAFMLAVGMAIMFERISLKHG